MCLLCGFMVGRTSTSVIDMCVVYYLVVSSVCVFALKHKALEFSLCVFV